MANFEAKISFGVDLTMLQGFLQRERYIDVKLQTGVDLKIISGHRVILAACSSYLDELFEAREKSQSGVLFLVLKHLRGEPLQALVNSFYTNCLIVNTDNVDGILATAKVLRLDSAIRACEDFIQRNASTTTCLELYSQAKSSQDKSLELVIKDFICANFMEITKTADFLTIGINLLMEIISSDYLEVKAENYVVDVCLKWLGHYEQRKKYVPKILHHIRALDLVPAYKLENIEIIDRWPEMKRLFRDLFLYGKCPENQTAIDPRIGTKKCLITILDHGEQKIFFKYCPLANQWTELMTLNDQQRLYATCIVNNDQLIIGGGIVGSEVVNSISCVNVNTGTDVYLDSMKTPRIGNQLVFHDSFIYAIGGCDNTRKSLNSVERFDLSNGTWQYIADMKEERYGTAAVILNGLLYAVGGWSGQIVIQDGNDFTINGTYYNSVECYDTSKNEWRICAPMKESRIWHQVAVLKNHIYAVGGSDGYTRFASVERYDPLNDTWTEISCLNTERSSFACVALNDRLLVAGGYNDDNTVYTTEEYNPKLDVWSPKASLPKSGFITGVLAIQSTKVHIQKFDKCLEALKRVRISA